VGDDFRLTLAQVNPVTGATVRNADQALDIIQSVADQSDLVAFPELFISGYPVQDLVHKHAFVEDCQTQVKRLARAMPPTITAAVGSPCLDRGKVYNAYCFLADGTITAMTRKHHLPNSGVFDEMRQFAQGPFMPPVHVGGIGLGVMICEDAWHADIAQKHAERGADILLTPNGSPYFRDRLAARQAVMQQRVVETGLPLVYINMIGGQDDQVFDGCSFILNPGGEVVLQMPAFAEAIQTVAFQRTADGWRVGQGNRVPLPEPDEMEYRAIVEGTRDYIRKNNFEGAVLGLSGGVDSAFVATVAADALGPEHVRCLLLPSRYTSEESTADATRLAHNLGCPLASIPIDDLFGAACAALADQFGNKPPDITEENLQSRLRGLLLMALSNKFDEILLTTGNKSEAAVGYATIYGDMAGGYNPVKDLYKTRLYDLCRWRNRTHRDWMKGPGGAPIPDPILVKPPSAELRPDQRDTDSLPPYDILDRILIMLIDEDCSVEDVVAEGFDRAMIKTIEQLIYRSEYKRHQSAPGVRLSDRAFWLDRRYPIVNQWRESRPAPPAPSTEPSAD